MSEDDFEFAFFGESRRDAWKRWTLKGSIVRSRRRFLDTRAPQHIDAIRQALGPEARRYLDDDVLVSARMPYPPLVELDKQIVLHAMGGKVPGMLTMAHDIAIHDLDGGLYRGLFRLIGGSLSLRIYALAYQTYFQPGSLTVVEGTDESTITLNEMILPRYMCRYGFSGYMERVLRMAGDKRAVRHDCAHDGRPRCVWRIGHFEGWR